MKNVVKRIIHSVNELKLRSARDATLTSPGPKEVELVRATI